MTEPRALTQAHSLAAALAALLFLTLLAGCESSDVLGSSRGSAEPTPPPTTDKESEPAEQPPNPTPDPAANPAPDDPAPDDPAPDDPVPDDPVPDNPAPDNPVPVEPAPDDPTADDPTAEPPPHAKPSAHDQHYEIDSGASLVGHLAGSGDAGEALTFHIASGPSFGALIHEDGDTEFHYTPDPDHADLEDAFTFTAHDGRESSDPATITIVIKPAPPPRAAAAGFSVEEGQTLAAQLSATPESDTLRFVLVQAPGHGQATLTTDGQFSYVPDHGFVGEDAFLFRVEDGDRASAPAEVNLTVTPLLAATFDEQGLQAWSFDDLGGAAVWEAREDALHQHNAFSAGWQGGHERGSEAVWTGGDHWQDYQFTAVITPASAVGDSVGLLFRYQDADNHYRFTLSAAGSFARLERKHHGEYAPLAVNARGYPNHDPLPVEILVDGPVLRVDVDGETIFSVYDDALGHGSVGLFTRGEASFSHIGVRLPERAPRLALVAPQAFAVSEGAALQVRAEPVGAALPGEVEFRLGEQTETLAQAPFQGFFSPLEPGDHTLHARLVDGGGVTVERVLAPLGVGGGYHVALGDSITAGVGDDFAGDNRSWDGRIVGWRGYQARLADLLSDGRSGPQVVFNEGVPGDTALDLQTRIETILARHPAAGRFLLMLGTNDAGYHVPTAVFRERTQAVVDKVAATGAEIYVAPAPYAPGREDRNARVSEYNQVILGTHPQVASLTGHRIGPDFYSFFMPPDRASMFTDHLHPNSVGYRVMARLWHNALSGADAAPFFLDGLSVSTGKAYLQVYRGSGDLAYIDRQHSLREIPEALQGGIWLMTADAALDRLASTDRHIGFRPSRDAHVYVAYDAAATKPAWLVGGFAPLPDSVLISANGGTPMALYQAKADADEEVVLGGNRAGGGTGRSHYLVVVAPR